MAFDDLRRALAAQGFVPATTRAAGSQGRREEAKIRPSELVEHSSARAIDVGAAAGCPEPVAFLDGVQRHQVVAYGRRFPFPLVAGVVAAAVRERVDRRLSTAVHEVRHVLVGRHEALEAATGLWDEKYHRVVLDEEESEHPVAEMDRAVAAIDDARSRLEVAVGEAFRARSNAWLIVDGSLAESRAFARDGRMLGVSKSHATLPFSGPDLETYLRLAPGHRSSVFQPASRRFAPVYAWGLRLWPWEGRDLLCGLVRVEAAPTRESIARADEFSRWILAERAPVSAPDARWDRLLYGIHNVEDFLAAIVPAHR
ncbi:MAG TPA: hypothetical protein VJU15_11375 [Gemmatimonadales bacterium]|nr:hypothetical protein [Gemmatimonadales bacterium]